MAKGRELKGRIRSVQNTRKITKTMELVATSKLKRAQDRVVAARPYAEALRQVIADLFTPDLAHQFALLRRPAPPSKGGPRRAVVILLTSNRGLAGGFNSNLIKEARRRVESLESEGYEVDLYGVGKKGIGFFKYLGRRMSLERTDIGDRPTIDHAGEVVQPLIEAYEAGELASVDLVYARFVSALQTPPTTVRILPVETAAQRGGRVRLPSDRLVHLFEIGTQTFGKGRNIDLAQLLPSDTFGGRVRFNVEGVRLPQIVDPACARRVSAGRGRAPLSAGLS